MDRSTRLELKQLAESAQRRAKEIRALLQARDRAERAADAAHNRIVERVRVVNIGAVRCAVLPLALTDLRLLADIAVAQGLMQIPDEAQSWLELYAARAAPTIQRLNAVVGLTRMFASQSAKQEAHTAEAWLREADVFVQRFDLDRSIARWMPIVPRELPQLRDAVSDGHEVAAHLRKHGSSITLLEGDVIARLPEAATAVESAAAAGDQLRNAIIRCGNDVRQAETALLVGEMPIERLKEVTKDRLRLGPLQELRWTKVAEVLANEPQLRSIPGIGELTAARIAGAAHALRQQTFDEMPVRMDVKRRSREATSLLRAIENYRTYRIAVRSVDQDRELIRQLGPLVGAVASGSRHIAVACGADSDARTVRTTLEGLAGRTAAYRPASTSTKRATGEPWDLFSEHAAEYFTILAELGFANENDEKVHGDLPQAIIDAVRDLELRGDHLNVSLRGYQSFAARFALVQKKVLIGDEMGLGKTIEALAVVAHLRSQGKTHFLVVCPAAVVTNWGREVSAKTTLATHRLHGPERDMNARNWRRRGGVAVTTYESLGWYHDHHHDIDIDCVIADEAHAIKNPDAKRSRRTAKLVASARHAVLMTGTPLENRVEEFRQLVSYIRPDLTLDVTDFTPLRFRKQVAPAYLRRNQEDVLTELPERVEVDEWLPLSRADEALYVQAVKAGNFMAMRQAAMLGGDASSKVERLREIIEEAEDNNHKFIVFSYFREVLSQLASLLPGRVFGPLNGSVPAHTRQTVVDEFTRVRGGAVLISQIQAGGVGLNIQAASVVVICEPQVKPTLEEQGIARAHRMGQIQSVQVHRLISEEGVDQRLLTLLADKRRLFNEFARPSDTAASAPEAYDLSEAALARQIVAEERQRLMA